MHYHHILISRLLSFPACLFVWNTIERSFFILSYCIYSSKFIRPRMKFLLCFLQIIPQPQHIDKSATMTGNKKQGDVSQVQEVELVTSHRTWSVPGLVSLDCQDHSCQSHSLPGLSTQHFYYQNYI